MNRRHLLKSIGTTTLLLGISRLVSAHAGNEVARGDESLVVESGPGQLVTSEFAHHHHLLHIPYSLLQEPPLEDAKLHTEWAQFRNPLANVGKHYHSVELSYDQLMLLRQGKIVEVQDTVKDHVYILRWP